MRKALLVFACSAITLLAWPSAAEAQFYESNLIRDNPLLEDMYYAWMEAAIIPPVPAVTLDLGETQFSVRCVSLGRTDLRRAGRGYCGFHLGRYGRPSIGLGLSMSRNIRPFPDPAAVIDFTFEHFSIVAMFETGDERREQHVFFMLRLDRIWRSINDRSR